MTTGLTRIRLENFRAFAKCDLALGPINVLFGPNGAGKSSLIDALWFLRDRSVLGINAATAARGVDAAHDGARNSVVTVEVESATATYATTHPIAGGRLQNPPTELLTSKLSRDIARRVPDKPVEWAANREHAKFDPVFGSADKPLTVHLDAVGVMNVEADELEYLWQEAQLVSARAHTFKSVKSVGSQAGPDTRLDDLGSNLWSVLRNLQGRSSLDRRYDTIVELMREAFPDEFEGLVLEATGPQSVYGSIVVPGTRKTTYASRAPDGLLQMLTLLTAIFSSPLDGPALLLLDEPDLSLHPWAIAVLARAIQRAARDHLRQFVIATHSPVLLSQFAPDQLIEVARDGEERTMRRLSDREDVQDLLAEFAPGVLYMSELVARQSRDDGGEPQK